MIQTEKIHYRGWPNCYRLANDRVDLILTADVGPRIIRFGFTEQANEFKEFDSEVGETGGNEWRSYGGHRLWHAPEAIPRTYSPDNSPVELRSSASGLHAIQSVEALTGIQKEIEITLDEQGAHARLVHRLRNLGLWTVELAAWCLTVMETGGTAIIPLPPRGPHPENLLPTGSIALWAYTDLSDARLTWGREMILMKQDPHSSLPQKIGASVPDGWVAYARSNHLFVKTFRYLPDAVYPDLGCCVEVFTDDQFLEIETLGAVRRLEPGGETEYIEDWYLFDEIPLPASESDVHANLLPAIRRLL